MSAARTRRGLRALLRRVGLDVVRYPAGTRFGANLQDVLQRTKPDLLVDVGACEGAFSDDLRRLGWSGRVLSVEPSPRQAAKLRRRALAVPSWTVIEAASGDEPGRGALNVSTTEGLTSLLAPSHVGLRRRSLRETHQVEIDVVRVDDVVAEHAPGARRIFLKSDTQGYDMRVLRGAERILERVVAIHVELTIEPLYVGATDYLELLAWLRAEGFEPSDLQGTIRDGGRLLEADCLLFRTASGAHREPGQVASPATHGGASAPA